ncbi:MAG TPA: GGDEF domain-containing protein [Luteimonas sp.]|nr:GGDEF domain-containing protein [Luteimonas sp.]
MGELLGRLLARPDEVMLEVGAGGELLVARVRALLSALLLLLPLINGLGGAATVDVVVGLGIAVFLNVMAQVWLSLARSRRRFAWLPFATATYDTTATTAVLALLAAEDRVAGLNSTVVWCFYLIAILMTALRNDGRLTLYVGGLAMLQFAVLGWAIFQFAPSPEALVSVDYGTASPASHGQRLVLLLMTTLLTATVVYRMQRLVELSGHDGLTGLPNRAWLLQRMPHVFATMRNTGGSMTLALLDMDQFRRINDALGHAGGDRALRHVAAAMSEAIAGGEVLVRLGGEEFVMVLHCPVGSAWERVDRLRRSLAERPFLPGRGDALAMTFSAGLAAWPQDGGTTSALLGIADRRLQEAKRAGRNRVHARDA